MEGEREKIYAKESTDKRVKWRRKEALKTRNCITQKRADEGRGRKEKGEARMKKEHNELKAKWKKKQKYYEGYRKTHQQ